MAEYLSPGVYVEEFEIGGKPVEGVSTSTAGFVGMAERGPTNKPIFIDSYAAYRSIFGGYLPHRSENDDYGELKWMPRAVEAFFSNGGKRAYVVRVAYKDTTLDPAKVAKTASIILPSILNSISQLAEESNPGAYGLKLIENSGFHANDEIAIKDGAQTEYRKLTRIAKRIIISGNLLHSYNEKVEFFKLKNSGNTVPFVTYDEEHKKLTLKDSVGNLKKDDIVQIEQSIRQIDDLNKENKTITLNKKLNSDPTDKKIQKLEKDKSFELLTDVKTGTNELYVSENTGISIGNPIKIGDEYHTIESVDINNIFTLSEPLKYRHATNTEVQKLIQAIRVDALNEGIWGDRIEIEIGFDSIATTRLTSFPSEQNHVDLESVVGIEKGSILKFSNNETRIVDSFVSSGGIKRVNLTGEPITIPDGSNKAVSTEEFNLKIKWDNVIEEFHNLSLDSHHSRFAEKIINNTETKSDGSNLIKVVVLSNGSSQPLSLLPAEQGVPAWKLSGGNNGIPENDDIVNVYKGKDDIEPSKRTGLNVLKNLDDLSIILMPGLTEQALQNELIIQCETMKDRFAILDSRKEADLPGMREQRNLYDTSYAALYYPWIKIYDTSGGQNINVPPSGFVAGIYARNDITRGVHKAPANETLNGAVGLEQIITTGQQDVLNPIGVNCIRSFDGRGTRIWGARTISSDPLWRYINVRRLFIYLEQSIYRATQWVAFEPNDIPLWARVRQTIDQFLTDTWRGGMLAGATADEAFFVKCDRTTMSQGDIDNGRLICIIGVAPVKPAEFVIFRIAQWTQGAKS